MDISDRPRKVDVVILGRGLAAAALAHLLVGRGRRVALLVEAPGWERGMRLARQSWHTGEQAALAAQGVARLEALQGDGVAGIRTLSNPEPEWLLDYDLLLPAIGARVAAAERSWVAEGTRVRGVSVIENRVLGAVAEDARYDARIVVNAAEGERHAAFARMMREPHTLQLQPFDLSSSTGSTVDHQNNITRMPAVYWDAGPPTASMTGVQGAWRVSGVAGWPLLALAVVQQLAEQLMLETS